MSINQITLVWGGLHLVADLFTNQQPVSKKNKNII